VFFNNLSSLFLRFSPPPSESSAQKRYEAERFRVQPGRIEDYSLGRGSLAAAQREAQKVNKHFFCLSYFVSKAIFWVKY
jgi:hypothetical protein